MSQNRADTRIINVISRALYLALPRLENSIQFASEITIILRESPIWTFVEKKNGFLFGVYDEIHSNLAMCVSGRSTIHR